MSVAQRQKRPAPLSIMSLGLLNLDAWRPRAEKVAPRAVSVVLTAIILWQLAHTTAALIAKPEIAVPHLTSQPPRRGIDVSRIVNQHVFGSAIQDPADQDPANAPASTSNLVLTGTLARKDPKRGKAIVAADGASKVLSVGDGMGGASLFLVYADRVILARHGALETLSLPRTESPQVRAVTARASRTTASGLPRAAPAAVESGNAAGPLVERYADANVETDGAGNMLGIRVVPGKDREGFVKSGLVGGDIIVSLDGAKLDSPDHSEEVWKRAGTGSTVTLLRRGKLVDLTLEFPP